MAENNKKKMSWSKSIETENIHKDIRVREVENGYVIDVTKDVKKEDGGWDYESKKYISKKNPINKSFEKEDDKKEDDLNVVDSIDLNDLDGINL